jgi:hypothetical protein
MRLFACACCRRIWHLVDETCKTAVEVSEQCADGAAREEKLDAANEAARERWHHYSSVAAGYFDPVHDSIDERMNSARYNAAAAADRAASANFDFLTHSAESAIRAFAVETAWNSDAYQRFANKRSPVPGVDDAHLAARQVESAAQCELLRDIFGNLFRRVEIDPTWQTPTVISLAEAIYEGRSFDRMPELAEALENSGCHEAEILSHCRMPTGHVRGCWVIDAMLGIG